MPSWSPPPVPGRSQPLSLTSPTLVGADVKTRPNQEQPSEKEARNDVLLRIHRAGRRTTRIRSCRASGSRRATGCCCVKRDPVLLRARPTGAAGGPLPSGRAKRACCETNVATTCAGSPAEPLGTSSASAFWAWAPRRSKFLPKGGAPSGPNSAPGTRSNSRPTICTRLMIPKPEPAPAPISSGGAPFGILLRTRFLLPPPTGGARMGTKTKDRYRT